MRFLWVSAVLFVPLALCSAQASNSGGLPDSDRDGLADAVEQSLLEQFVPRFMVSGKDCSTRPAEFAPSMKAPRVAAENGTIYGQAFPVQGRAGEIELHYYDLWRKDCGESGHNLDAEHVSVLLDRDEAGAWKARYWYAAAHEDTLCDASQITRAKALDAEQHGPEVWVSSGKHAAFLSRASCHRGCGADDCEAEQQLADVRVVNLGELSAPMNGATWSASTAWPLSRKMGRSDFDPSLTARLESLPADEIAWANPGKRSAQAAILGGNAALGGAATGVRATDSALTTADANTSDALDTASRKTGNALVRSYRGVLKVLRGASGSKAGTVKEK